MLMPWKKWNELKIVGNDTNNDIRYIQGFQDAVDDYFPQIIDDAPIIDGEPDKGWISVHDRLPETDAIGVAHVLAYDKYEGVVKADFLDEPANYRYGSNISEISNTSTRLYKVTHWMPLPKPPKEVYGVKMDLKDEGTDIWVVYWVPYYYFLQG